MLARVRLLMQWGDLTPSREFGPGASRWRAWFSWPFTGSWALSSSWEHLMVLDLQTLGVAVTSSAKALPQSCFLWVTLVSSPSLLGKWDMPAVGWWEDVGTHHKKTMENPELLALMQALESITTNKASGGDGIPVQLFWILKDDAWKCCTQYASKFGKLSSGHRTGKGWFSFQSQRKAIPKNAQTTAQLHSSHTLVK